MAQVAADVTSQLSKTGCSCLNEDPRFPHTNLFIGDHTLPLKSDADEQLLLQLAFMQTMKLSSITIGVPDGESCPRTVKLFCNKPNMGFEDAQGTYNISNISHCDSFSFLLLCVVNI
jgi:PITH domain